MSPHSEHDSLPSERVIRMEEEEREHQDEMKRQRDPPIVFKTDMDYQAEYEALNQALEGKLDDTEKTNLVELHQYVLENEGSWALGDNFLNFVGRFHTFHIIKQKIVFILQVLTD